MQKISETRPLRRRCSPLVQANQNRLGKKMPACLALDIPIRRVLTDPQVVGGERKQPEMIVMGSMAPRRAWPAVARSPKIIECLHEPFFAVVPGGVFRQPCAPGWNVVGGPMMPSACWGIRVVAEDHKAAGWGGWIAPIERR